MSKKLPNQSFRLTPIAILLSEKSTTPPTKVQVIRTGTFHHEKYGKFEVTKEHLLSFKKNFDDKVRRIDIALDYGHESEGEAAAWFKDLELSDDGTELWAIPEWTPEGGAAVLSKRYRYLSADFNFDYEDNETLKKYGPTLLGAGLTNRPVVKGQAPVIELTEGKGNVMDPKDQEIADLKKKITELEAKIAASAAPKAGEDAPALEEAKKEVELKDAQLSEMKKELSLFKKTAADAAKKSAFDAKLSEGSVCEAQREAYMAGDMDKFLSLASSVKLSEKGSGGTPAPAAGADVQTEVLKLAEKMVSEKRASNTVEGTSLVLKENADLRKRYEAAQV